MCYGFIYDTIVNPYHKVNPLHKISLTNEEAHRISTTFLNIISEFRDVDFFDDMDKDISLEQCDEWTWVKFEEENPDGFAKLIEELNETSSSMKLKKRVSEFLVTRFFMNKLRILMMILPQIHNEHCMKRNIIDKSPGPVPYNKLVEIRLKAGLSPPPYRDLTLEELY